MSRAERRKVKKQKAEQASSTNFDEHVEAVLPESLVQALDDVCESVHEQVVKQAVVQPAPPHKFSTNEGLRIAGALAERFQWREGLIGKISSYDTTVSDTGVFEVLLCFYPNCATARAQMPRLPVWQKAVQGQVHKLVGNPVQIFALFGSIDALKQGWKDWEAQQGEAQQSAASTGD